MTDLVSQLVGALEKLCGTSDDPRNGWRGTGGTDVLFACEYCGAKHEDCTKIEHTNSCPIPTARAALTAAKAGGWVAVPVEAARLAGVALSEHPGHSPLTDWEDAAMKACSLLAARPLPNPPKDPA